MYRCKECGKLFEEPWEFYDKATGCHESGCIYCESDDYESVYECPKCKDSAAESPGELCQECKEEVYKALSDIKCTLMNYGMDEYDAVNVVSGWAEMN